MTLSEADIRLAYQHILDRTASEAEVEHMFKAGHTAGTLGQAFIRSAEFKLKFKARETQERGVPALVHLHVPKSAGSSLTSILAKNFPKRQSHALTDGTLAAFGALPAATRRQARFVSGHLVHGLDHLLPQGCLYVCVLRPPGPRLLSYFRFMKRRKIHPMYATLNRDDMSFGQFLEYCMTDRGLRTEADNGQIRRLAGRAMAHNSFGNEPAVFRAALKNIFADTMVFGLTAHFDLLLEDLVARKLISGFQEVKANVDPEPANFDAARDELTAHQLDLLDIFTRWDARFYDICESFILGLTADRTL